MMHFILELATILIILKNSDFVADFCMILTIHILLCWSAGPTTLESGWPFGNFCTENGQRPVVIFKSVRMFSKSRLKAAPHTSLHCKNEICTSY